MCKLRIHKFVHPKCGHETEPMLSQRCSKRKCSRKDYEIQEVRGERCQACRDWYFHLRKRWESSSNNVDTLVMYFQWDDELEIEYVDSLQEKAAAEGVAAARRATRPRVPLFEAPPPQESLSLPLAPIQDAQMASLENLANFISVDGVLDGELQDRASVETHFDTGPSKGIGVEPPNSAGEIDTLSTMTSEELQRVLDQMGPFDPYPQLELGDMAPLYG